jgi:RNA polymerase sigma-70 factor, ECF subfamily
MTGAGTVKVATSNKSPLAREQTDRALLERVVARDRDAFRELYVAYHRRLARFLMRLTRRYEVAEEIINDTFWIVWRKAAQFRGESLVSTWIMGIAYRRGLKALRGSAARLADGTDIESEQLAAPDDLAAAELSEWILLAMSQLPTEQRVTLEFAYGYGHSCEEIAQIMDCPTNTVKTRLFHGREKLRRLLPGLAGQRSLS